MNKVVAPGYYIENPFNFALPAELEASEPPEARGLARDQVRLMVSYRANDRVIHTRFRELTSYLAAGDLLVINTSGTMNAALQARRADGTACELHLSTRLPGYIENVANEAVASTLRATRRNENLWVVELRLPSDSATEPFYSAEAGEVLQLPGDATATLLVPYSRERTVQERCGREITGWEITGRGLASLRLINAAAQLPCGSGETKGEASPLQYTRKVPVVDKKYSGDQVCPERGHTRLWIARLCLPLPVNDYLERYGFPIRYGYVKQQWPSSYYQTVYATEVGSAEMPSAGRAFTPELITQLVARGVQIAPLILHTGVASLEEHEPPYEEYYRVPLETSLLVNSARKAGKRVMAVGTTVVRALETVTDIEGITHPGEGWTSLVVTPQRGMRAVNAMLTGLHEPFASHLAMLETLAGREHLQVAYAEALRERYLWHEFGDLHLILP